MYDNCLHRAAKVLKNEDGYFSWWTVPYAVTVPPNNAFSLITHHYAVSTQSVADGNDFIESIVNSSK